MYITYHLTDMVLCPTLRDPELFAIPLTSSLNPFAPNPTSPYK